jgi:hypothetical protein
MKRTLIGFYDTHILPHVVHLACSTRPVMRQRQKVVPRARGCVLEVGIGSGLNLPFYDPAKVSKVWGLGMQAGAGIRSLVLAHSPLSP